MKTKTRGRPVSIPWNLIPKSMWNARTDREIKDHLQEKYGKGTVVAVYLKRRALNLKADYSFHGEAYTRNSRAVKK